ncbi:hypothetical protein BU16DRAFT_562997 [Lophium mytilinum]|uniref:Uncharacterized protein n=1 Tax=Lophium mytilinum TaxID=390894 RepID=A0A6A6QPJ1_9PEZI|nr:hypothetical protein BU16DRAFT_562997 [Lophium mytilinum]
MQPEDAGKPQHQPRSARESRSSWLFCELDRTTAARRWTHGRFRVPKRWGPEAKQCAELLRGGAAGDRHLPMNKTCHSPATRRNADTNGRRSPGKSSAATLVPPKAPAAFDRRNGCFQLHPAPVPLSLAEPVITPACSPKFALPAPTSDAVHAQPASEPSVSSSGSTPTVAPPLRHR